MLRPCTRTVARKSAVRGLNVCAGGLHILKIAEISQKNSSRLPSWFYRISDIFRNVFVLIISYLQIQQKKNSLNYSFTKPFPCNIKSLKQWCSRDRNLRDRDLAQTSRPRPRLFDKSRDRDLEVRDRNSRPHISLMVIKAISMKKAAKNIWNVAKYQDKGDCHCYASINLFWLRQIVTCLVRKTLLIIVCKVRTCCPDEAPMFWPATQYWGMLLENVEKRWIIWFYFNKHTRCRRVYIAALVKTAQ